MTSYSWGSLTNGQHLDFDPLADTLTFGSGTASLLKLLPGANLKLTLAGKSVFLDGVQPGQLASGSISFANGSQLLLGDGTASTLADWYGQSWNPATSTVGNQLWGLGGADLLVGGSGNDWLVGNTAYSALNHVSRVGNQGAPTGTAEASISADGRFVAFYGGWTEFGSSSNNAQDVLAKDMQTGVVVNEHRTWEGVTGGSGSGVPQISADGQWLVFLSNSANMVPGNPPSGTLYIASTTSGEIAAVSTTSGGVYADRPADNPDVSADGTWVVFESWAGNLDANGSTAYTDIYVKNTVTGELQRVSTSLTGGDGNGESINARISADGRYVVFESEASNLTADDTNGYADIFLWDRTDGSLRNLTGALDGQNLANHARNPDIAWDDALDSGVVVFETGRRLVAGDDYSNTDVYAISLSDGSVSLVSSTADGSDVQLSSGEAAVSGDGRFVVFRSGSDELEPGDTNGYTDIYVKDLLTGAIALVSRAANGALGNQYSSDPEISLGGDWIVFESGATNFATTDGNGGFGDIFRVSNPLLRDTLRGGTGNDTYVIARAGDLVVENARGGTDTVQAGVSYTLGANVENLTLTGNNAINGTGNGLANVLAGNGAANVLDGGAGNDTASYAGAAGAITASLAITTAQATGAGMDRFVSIENLVGSAFGDALTGNAAANRLDGGGGNDTLRGGGGNDTLVGGEGGNNALYGGTGNDTYVFDSPYGSIVENLGEGTDTVVSSVNWVLLPTLENLTLSGTAAINGTGNQTGNVLRGNSAANVLKGYGANDTLVGGGGNDTLSGGAGGDRLTGGAGLDTFLFESATGSDMATDFVAGTDRLQFSHRGLGAIGDGDLLVEGGLVRGAPGGFSPLAELVIFTADQAGIETANAAAAIGSASSAYAIGDRRLFVTDDGGNSAVFLFTSADADANVSAAELVRLVTLSGATSTALGDYLFAV